MENNNLIDRLNKLLTGRIKIPYEELKWLATHGKVEKYEAGTLIAQKGKRWDKLLVILAGNISIKRDRGLGPEQVAQWRSGAVSGRLPYSRMKETSYDIYLEEKIELLTIHEKQFPEMINKCPAFTEYTVHSMLDRARSFNTSELHYEKMISLGKLSAGLAHELNNPASAAIRSAKLLFSALEKAEAVSRMLGTEGLSDDIFNTLKEFCSLRSGNSSGSTLTPIQQIEHEEKIAKWLFLHNMDTSLAEALSATAVTINDLEKLNNSISGNILAPALEWIAAVCTTRSLALDIEQATTRISELVSAVKRFTYMDKMGAELVNIEAGLKDTIRILASKAKSKNAVISLDAESSLPRVKAAGAELNQVWLNLIDNALDAIADSGYINITARQETDRVVVRIADNGIGIPSEIISLIFDPFFTTKPPGQGTGLGLDVTHRLLRQFSGDITVQSEPGLTEFRVSLPASKNTIEGTA